MAAADIGARPLRAVTAARDASLPASRALATRLAGLFLALPGIAILMGVITGEALYPAQYTTHADTLSHLGATEPPNSIALQPSATIFDATMLASGALILIAACLTLWALRSWSVSIPIALLGIGVFGVGVFPLTSPTPHTLLAILAFYSGGVGAILSGLRTTSPFRYLAITLGVVSLVAITLGLFASGWAPVASLGEGGIERWNNYPVVLWLVAFGGYLMAAGDRGLSPQG